MTMIVKRQIYLCPCYAYPINPRMIDKRFIPNEMLGNTSSMIIEYKGRAWFKTLRYFEEESNFPLLFWQDEILAKTSCVFDDENLTITVAYGSQYMFIFKRTGEEFEGTFDEMFCEDWYDFKRSVGTDTGCDDITGYLRSRSFPTDTSFWTRTGY